MHIKDVLQVLDCDESDDGSDDDSDPDEVMVSALDVDTPDTHSIVLVMSGASVRRLIMFQDLCDGGGALSQHERDVLGYIDNVRGIKESRHTCIWFKV